MWEIEYEQGVTTPLQKKEKAVEVNGNPHLPKKTAVEVNSDWMLKGIIAHI